ncbi:MAG: SDR family oxidoreductase [Deferribacteraceae bacterium]|jgi:3-oxoacyl-[acyl-carrier protein] reductase|nr:SDR family oxidoreductase [Deferribacteraceae bacterium]
MKELENKTALVIGATGGIGGACALKAAGSGARLALAYHNNKEGALALADRIISAGSAAEIFYLDVRSSASCKEVFAAIESSPLGGVDILINSAGIRHEKSLLETTDEEIDQVLQTNLYGIFYASRAAARHMMKKRWGRIINIIGYAAFLGIKREGAYSASKGGAVALTKTLAKELGSRNITVNAVAPGLTDTKLIKKTDNVLIDDYLNYAIVKRLGTADEVADAVRFLALPSAEYITGQVIHTNGGLYL